MDKEIQEPDLDIVSLLRSEEVEACLIYEELKRSQLNTEAEIAKIERNLERCRSLWSNHSPPGRLYFLGETLAKQGWWGIVGEAEPQPMPWNTSLSTRATKVEDSAQVEGGRIVPKNNTPKVNDVEIGDTDFNELIGTIEELNLGVPDPYYLLESPGWKGGKILLLRKLFGREELDKWSHFAPKASASSLPNGSGNQENILATYHENYLTPQEPSNHAIMKPNYYGGFKLMPEGSFNHEIMQPNYYCEENLIPQGSTNREIMNPTYYEEYSLPQGPSHCEIMQPKCYAEYSMGQGYDINESITYNEKRYMSQESGNYEIMKPTNYEEYSSQGSEDQEINMSSFHEEYYRMQKWNHQETMKSVCYEEYSVLPGSVNNEIMKRTYYEQYSKVESTFEEGVLQGNVAIGNPIGSHAKQVGIVTGNSRVLDPPKPTGLEEIKQSDLCFNGSSHCYASGFRRQFLDQPSWNELHIRQKKHYREGSGCSFCVNCPRARDLGLWETHVLRSKGKVVCPKLRGIVCDKCHATGDIAHTIGHCPDASIDERNQVRNHYRKLARKRSSSR